jgi:2-methylcitrate dehydratase PrpD
MSVVSLILDAGLDAVHPARWPAEIEIKTNSGLSYCGQTDFPRGDPENPLSAGDLLQKFYDLAAGPWGEQKAEMLGKTVLDLEHVENLAALF